MPVRARILEDAHCLHELVARLTQTVRLAVEHGQVVMQRGKPPVAGSVGCFRVVKRLAVQVFRLVVLPCGAHGSGGVDERRRPRLAAGDSHADAQFERPLHNPLVVLVPSLGTVESHRFVEDGQQSGVVAGVFGIGHCLLQVGFGVLTRAMLVIDGVQTGEERVYVKSVVMAV